MGKLANKIEHLRVINLVDVRTHANTLVRKLTDDPKGLSGLMTLLINTLIIFSSLSCSGSGAPPSNSSPLPSSNVAVNMGIRMYCKICVSVGVGEIIAGTDGILTVAHKLKAL